MIIGISALLVCLPALAESPPNFSDGLPPPADVSKPTPTPTQEPQDRADGSGAAIAMAAVGAAMAGVSCVMLMRQAQQETDPSKRSMLMAMAMQQCAQAGQDAANAAQNGSGKDTLTKPQGPAGSQLAPLPTLAEEKSKSGSSGASPYQQSSTEAQPQPSQLVDTDSYQPSDDVFVNPSAGDDSFSTGLGGVNFSKLNPIEHGSVKYDDSAKGNEKTIKPPLGDSTTQFAFSGGLAVSANGQKDENAESNKDGKRKDHSRQPSSTGASSSGEIGSGSSLSSSSGSLDISAMMNKLLGKASAGAGNIASQFVKLTAHKGASSSSRLPNIFEYASYRIRLGEKDGLIHGKRDKMKNAAASDKPSKQIAHRS